MRERIIKDLTAKDDQAAFASAERIIAESRESNRWYAYLDVFVSLLNHPKSLVRNRALCILAENARWDEQDRFDSILPDFLIHVTDEKPITARQCIQMLVLVGMAKPQYIPRILDRFHEADLSMYKDSMRSLIERDMQNTENILLTGV